MVYTGNIGSGRYKQLAHIGKAIDEINKSREDVRFELDIYSMTPMTKKMDKALTISEAVSFKGAADIADVPKIQGMADILIHAESFDLKNRLAVHQSFSTKIVDYLWEAKCIFAVGPRDVASIDYLIKNDAAIAAVTVDEIKKKIEEIANNKNIIYEYGEKAWKCGKKNHQIDDIQKKLKTDFDELLDRI